MIMSARTFPTVRHGLYANLHAASGQTPKPPWSRVEMISVV
jgi:protein-S-isoprenylcysteine O-methyltransferase Ste14